MLFFFYLGLWLSTGFLSTLFYAFFECAYFKLLLFFVIVLVHCSGITPGQLFPEKENLWDRCSCSTFLRTRYIAFPFLIQQQ